jgi:hypothetical protein
LSGWEFVSDPDVAAHTGFVLAEEAALKQYLSGLTVPDQRSETGTSEVPVWFRWPESERRMSYPFITIDLLSVSAAYERWHSTYNVADAPSYFEGVDGAPDRWGIYYPGYTSQIETDEDKTYYIERYLPYNLLFQISVHARSAFHDRYLTSRFVTDVFPPRGDFWIDVAADHAARRCELVQWVSGDTMETTEAGKRIFRKVYTVLMETEIPASRIFEFERIRTVHIDMYDTLDTGSYESVGHPVDGPHTSAVASTTVTAEP